MKKFSFSLVVVLALILVSSSSLQSQDTIFRQVIGSGGGVFETNSNGYQLSGMTGQTAIKSFTLQGGSRTLHQGFWVPYETGYGVEEEPITLSSDLQNFPNPFSNYTRIKYSLPGVSRVTLRIYDMVGRMRVELVNSIQGEGEQEIIWDGRAKDGVDVPAGSYLYELTAKPTQLSGPSSFDEFTLRNVMVIVR